MCKLVTLLLLVQLALPAAVWAADACDGAARELDNLAQQIARIIEGCEDVSKNPCSKEQYVEIDAQIKPLVARGIKLTQDCFGAPGNDGLPGQPPDNRGAQ